MRRSRIVCILLLLIVIAVSGCLKGRYDPNLSIGEQIRTRHYNHSAMVFGKNELLDEILAAAEEKNVGRIEELFSAYASEEDKELKNEIGLLCDSFPRAAELKDRGCSEFGSHNRGSTEYNYLYEPVVRIIDDKGDKYRLVVMWIEGDSEHPEKQGLHSIQLISEARYNSHDYTIHSQNDRPGVYVYI